MRSGLEEDSCLCCCSWLRPRRAAEGSRSCFEVLVVELLTWAVVSRLGEDWLALSPARSPLLPLPGLRWRVFTLRDRLGEVELLLGQAGIVTCITEESILGMITSDLRMSGLKEWEGLVKNYNPQGWWIFTDLFQFHPIKWNLTPLSRGKFLWDVSLLDEFVHGIWRAALSGTMVLEQSRILLIQRLFSPRKKMPPKCKCTKAYLQMVLAFQKHILWFHEFICTSATLSLSAPAAAWQHWAPCKGC